ncbi:MAG: 50S ribosomal protein L15 [Candidatus Bathyarchaeota archaeon]|nr:50S ribosomal protein L15 [Candidatus Bathyarchaeota archaeon]
MPHTLRKTRKRRGSRTMGWGRVGQHRRARSRGNAGRHKHLWSYVQTYEPDYFSKKGFYSPRQRRVNVLNVGDLEDLAAELSRENRLEERDELPFLDLDSMGYDKLLGLGRLTKPFSIKVASYSESANKKIEEIGGKILDRVS